MTHKHIIELANGTPIKKYRNGADEPSHESWTKARETYINYEFTIEERITIEDCPKPKELYGYDFCGHDALVSYINHLNL